MQPRRLGQGEGRPTCHRGAPCGRMEDGRRPRHLEEREGRAGCPAIPEGGGEDCCLGASCTAARTLAAGERRMGAYAPPAGRLGDEALGPRVCRSGTEPLGSVA